MVQSGQEQLFFPAEADEDLPGGNDDEGIDQPGESEASSEERHFEADLYKKFYRRRDGAGGFLTLRAWPEAGKVAVDIGALRPGGGLASHTEAWTGMVELAVYLKAVTDGRAEGMYPARPKAGLPTAEGLVIYGGSTKGGITSRILKIHWWQTGEQAYSPEAFAWKTAHFPGKRLATGAIIPDGDKPLSVNMIQRNRIEMAEMSYRLGVYLSAYASRHQDWLADMNGRKKS